ncbi:MAG TPA: hypothetical protein V6D13_11650 [Halomicronema sp.]
MTESIKDPVVASAAALLTHYSFDLGASTAERLLIQWQKEYPGNWLRLAVIEALYQGRYKAVSVSQILAMWKRRGETLYHFNYEFERLIYRNLPVEFYSESSGFFEEEKKVENPVLIVEPLPELTSEVVLPSQNYIENSNAIPPWQPIGKQKKVEVEKEKVKKVKVENNVQKITVPAEEKATEPEKVITPIESFIPQSENVEFYSKLRAVSQPNESLSSESSGVISLEDMEEIQRDLWDE